MLKGKQPATLLPSPHQFFTMLCNSAGGQGRVRRLKDVTEIVPPDVCEDFHEECPQWGKQLGCQVNRSKSFGRGWTTVKSLWQNQLQPIAKQVQEEPSVNHMMLSMYTRLLFAGQYAVHEHALPPDVWEVPQ